MKTYVINLKRRPDRRAQMEKILPRDLDVTFTTDWDGPLDGAEIRGDSLKGFGIFPSWKMVSENVWWSRPLKKGELGCSISHWSCWKDAVASGEDRAIFFEDDIRLAQSFMEKLAATIQCLQQHYTDWDLLYLGRLPLMPDFPAGHGFVRPGYSYGAHAYMLSRAGLEKILSVRFEQQLIPADEFLPAMYFPHPRPDVARRFKPILKAFALEQKIVFQLPKERMGSDTEATGFVDWIP